MSYWTSTVTRTLSGLALAAVLCAGSLCVQPQSAHAQIYERVAASCGNCFGSVSLNARVGDTCPHCGAVWGAERTSYTAGTPRRSRRHSSRRARTRRAAPAPRPAATATINGRQVPSISHQGRLCVRMREAVEAAGGRVSGSPVTGRFQIRIAGRGSFPCVINEPSRGGALPAYSIGGKTFVSLREFCQQLEAKLTYDRKQNRYQASVAAATMKLYGRR